MCVCSVVVRQQPRLLPGRSKIEKPEAAGAGLVCNDHALESVIREPVVLRSERQRRRQRSMNEGAVNSNDVLDRECTLKPSGNKSAVLCGAAGVGKGRRRRAMVDHPW